MTDKEFADKWHYKLVKPKNYYQIPDKNYFVTAALLDLNGGKIAIMAEDYSLENKQWITIELSTEEIDELDNRFEILGDYNNIESEATTETINIENIDGERIVTFRCAQYPKWEYFELKTKDPNQYRKIGDKLYIFMYRSTTGELLIQGFDLENQKDKNNDELYTMFQEYRGWVKSGLYHFGPCPKCEFVN